MDKKTKLGFLFALLEEATNLYKFKVQHKEYASTENQRIEDLTKKIDDLFDSPDEPLSTAPAPAAAPQVAVDPVTQGVG